jgi:hypothetical protein
MSIQLRVDGAKHTGTYRVECECGDTWGGQGEPIGAVNWSPALPIAECCVHVKMLHPNAGLDLQFSERFRDWLLSYWERANLRLAAAGKATHFGAAQGVVS